MANVTCPQLLLLSPRVGDTYVDNVRNQACMSNSTCRHFLQQCVADTNENRNENSAQYRSHLDCINSFDQCVRPCVTRADITYATKAWCDGLLKLSQLYSDDDAQHAADGFVRDAYGPASGDSVVLFKPTLATGQDASRYRTQHDEIARYFAGSDGEMQGDGFARKNRWNSCEPRVYASRKDGCVAIALGSVTLNGHDADGKPVRVKVDKTWSFVPSADDPRRLQIVSHHSSLQV